MTDALDELAELEAFLRDRALAHHVPTAKEAARWLLALERAKQNERRYLWLRENWWNYSSDANDAGYPIQSCIGGVDWWAVRDAVCEVKSHPELDTAIDAALAQQEAP